MPAHVCVFICCVWYVCACRCGRLCVRVCMWCVCLYVLGAINAACWSCQSQSILLLQLGLLLPVPSQSSVWPPVLLLLITTSPSGRLQAKVRRWQTPQWGDLAVGFQRGCDQPGLFFWKALAAAWENWVEVVALPWGLV
uniref:Secreted protein n=1 Tax=Molossus molossus TaxID=27622 RepID=A0A7J8BBJ7_MOLMO|nr:hypothetical protein HJG59_010467 [Molossus molossus]